ncbi:hypothetical protein B0H17DRAFT_1168870 [Mycena rosella]|uniref:NAD(P)-binding domain-containing protein n=1 Tax=Mycena rosella TaxID=1033263 RepID=A0AAD7DKD5_MYCRO|nr:hypothetical protein B0H17DRAFT_1168870 [Mycena rosella]
MAALNVLTFGASRNIGYFAAVRLLEKGATVTFLLRSLAVFDEDTLIQGYVKSGRVRLVKGDAANEADTRLAWDTAGVVDVVLFTVGTVPTFSIFKGMVFEPPNPTTQCMSAVLCTMPTYAGGHQPKFIALSSIGLTPPAHAALPLLIKPLYAMLELPHRDKIGLERVLAHCSGRTWDDTTDGVARESIMGENWTQREGLPAPGTLKHVLVVRPAILTDGICVADEVATKGKGKSYRASEQELGAYTISRKDVAHFLVDAIARWNEFENKTINVGY